MNINGGVGTIGTINNQEGRLADPLNMNGGVGTIGTIKKEDMLLSTYPYPELLPCPYYSPYTWTPIPEAVGKFVIP